MQATICVSDLLDASNTGGWNSDLINKVFLPFEANAILKIPLFLHWGKDQQECGCTKNGLFSVKSTYYLVFSLKNAIESGSHEQDSSYRLFWKTLWKLQLPNKVKNFIWRACRDSLPTKSHLFHRKIVASSLCAFSCEVEEDIFHILCKCSTVHPVWEKYFGDSVMLASHAWFDSIV